MVRVIWTPSALRDLKEIVDYIWPRGPEDAVRLAERLMERTDLLASFPRVGGQLPEDDTRVYRELIEGNYRIIFRVDDDAVYIVAVRHAARLLDPGELH